MKLVSVVCVTDTHFLVDWNCHQFLGNLNWVLKCPYLCDTHGIALKFLVSKHNSLFSDYICWMKYSIKFIKWPCKVLGSCVCACFFLYTWQTLQMHTLVTRKELLVPKLFCAVVYTHLLYCPCFLFIVLIYVSVSGPFESIFYTVVTRIGSRAILWCTV